MRVKCFNCSVVFDAGDAEDGARVTCSHCGAPNVIHHGMVSFGSSDTDSQLNGQPVPNPSSGDIAVPGGLPGSEAPTMDLSEEKTMFLGENQPTVIENAGGDIHEEKTMFLSPDQEVDHSAATMPMPPKAPPPPSEAPTVAPTPPAAAPARGGEDYIPFSGDSGGPTEAISRPAESQNPTMALPPREDQAPNTSGLGVTSPINVSEDVTAPAPAPQEAPRKKGSSSIEPSRPIEGKMLGGYKVKKRLGAGGMGAVYLAEQVNLDRDVALKILPSKYASDPSFIARFTREALSAAQLSHHNIIQVFDIGNDEEIHYISMELVKGRDLGDMVRRDGKLQPEDAASYVLQAARGLSYAHRHGIVHRDIKPDNMMLNDNGIVKIADMGLAKMRGHREASVGLAVPGTADALREQAYGELTGAEMAMGTPAFMAPEQGRDASGVDHRADQYSLGCTLYYMIAGKTPFSGKTSFEIISKHQTAPLIPIESIVRNVPSELSFIIQKMLSKNPEERYNSLEEVIDALEDYLGISAEPGTYTPRDHHVAILEKELADFHGIAARKLGTLVPLGFNVGVGLAAILGPILFGMLNLSGGGFFFASCLGLLVLTPLFSFLLNGFLTKEFFYRRARSLVFGTSLKGWGLIILGSFVTLLALYFTGLLVPWIVVSFIAAGLAAAWQFLYLKPMRAKVAPHLEATHEMLKMLRIRGVAEETIQDFVCRFSGERWEEFFEALFGYEDMVTQRARSIHLDKVKPRKRFRTWRDPVARWLDEIEEARKRDRERRQLAKAEKQRLKSEGVSEQEAEKQAKSLADQAMDEGLLKETAIIPSKAELRKASKEREKLATELHKSSRKGLPGPNALYRLVRFLAGVVVLGGAILPLSGQGDALPGIARTILGFYYQFSTTAGATFAMSIYAIVPGVALLVSAFSKRFLLPTLILLSAIVSVGCVAVASINPTPMVGPAQLAYGGVGASLVFLVLLLITRNRRREF